MRRLTGLSIDVYARVSRVGDERHRSTDGQVADCKARILDAGGAIGAVWIDQGKSAWNPRIKRLEWHQLMERLESGLAQGVIVFDLARFSRRPIEGERLIAAAERGLVVLDSEGEFDLTSASGKKAFRDQMASAAYESDRTSTRTSRGKRAKALAGESNHSTRPWGFEPDGFTPREPEATELRQLVSGLLAGKSLLSLMHDLNRRGVPTSTGRTWSHSVLRLTLLRPRNAGLASHRNEITGRLPGDPIVSREDWDQVVAHFAARRRGRPAGEAYLFSGVVHCGRCGNALNGRPRASGVREYFCHKRGPGRGCNGTSVRQSPFDAHAVALILAVLADPRHAARIEEEARAVTAERHALEAALAQAETTALQLSDRLGRGEITFARYDAAMMPLDRRIAELRERLEEMPLVRAARLDPSAVAASLADWERRWDQSSYDQRRALIIRALIGKRLVLGPSSRRGSQAFDPGRIRLVDV